MALNSGDGNDRIKARDGVAERISCGSGSDTVVADAPDVTAADCEIVDRPSATPVATLPGAGNAQPRWCVGQQENVLAGG